MIKEENFFEFYEQEKANNSQLWQRFKKREARDAKLKSNPLFLEAKKWFWACKNDIFKDPKNAHLRKSIARLDG